jgi:hypothetical protein
MLIKDLRFVISELLLCGKAINQWKLKTGVLSRVPDTFQASLLHTQLHAVLDTSFPLFTSKNKGLDVTLAYANKITSRNFPDATTNICNHRARVRPVLRVCRHFVFLLPDQPCVRLVS